MLVKWGCAGAGSRRCAGCTSTRNSSQILRCRSFGARIVKAPVGFCSVEDTVRPGEVPRRPRVVVERLRIRSCIPAIHLAGGPRPPRDAAVSCDTPVPRCRAGVHRRGIVVIRCEIRGALSCSVRAFGSAPELQERVDDCRGFARVAAACRGAIRRTVRMRQNAKPVLLMMVLHPPCSQLKRVTGRAPGGGPQSNQFPVPHSADEPVSITFCFLSVIRRFPALLAGANMTTLMLDVGHSRIRRSNWRLIGHRLTP